MFSLNFSSAGKGPFMAGKTFTTFFRPFFLNEFMRFFICIFVTVYIYICNDFKIFIFYSDLFEVL